MQFLQILQDKILKCPVCGESLTLGENGKSLYYTGKKRHCFDIAAKGYVNLSPSHSGGGDSKEAIRSRSAFLEKGYYRPFADKLCEILSEYVNHRIVETGNAIYQGNVQVAPFVEGQMSSCDYCPYKAICGFDGKIDGFEERKLQKIDKKDLFDRMATQNALDKGTAKGN